MSSKCNYIIFFAITIKAIYLALVENKVTVSYLMEHKFTGPQLNIKMNPNMDFWLSKSPAQSESEYSSINSFSWLLLLILYYFVSIIYFNII